MQQKKDTKPNKNAKNDRNTSYYRARVKVAAKKKKDSSAYVEKAKKRQMTSYKRALLVLFALMLLFTGVIFLGMFLNNLVINGEEPETTAENDWEDIFTTDPNSPPENSASAGHPSFPEIENPGSNEISEIFYRYNGAYLDVSKIDSLESLQFFADNIKSKGINAVNIDIKKEDGTVPYHVNSQTDSVMIGENQIDIQIGEIIGLLHENGLYVSGTICCFKDNLAASTFVNYAIKSSSDLMRWEDVEGDLWMSAYSTGAQEYVKGIVEESARLGFDEIILSWFFFPNISNENYLVYGNENDSRDKYAAVKDFVTDQRRALDQIAPKIKLGFHIPLQYFLNVPNETMGLNPADISEWCNFFATDFFPSKLSDNSVINGETLSNPVGTPYETAKALCGHFKFISENMNFRPYLQAFKEYGEQQITNQKQALIENEINVWQLVNYDNYY
ncbi:MAG: putative glycoside hydrolase [Oscillospiraceae bacterium]|nr:putative glycoside hydrolase [Oscillospiraceae bacterium]